MVSRVEGCRVNALGCEVRDEDGSPREYTNGLYVPCVALHPPWKLLHSRIP